MKKYLALLLAAVMVFALTACGGKTETPAPKTETPSEPAKTEEKKEEAPAEKSGLTEPVDLQYSTFTVGGNWYVYGSAFSELMLKQLPEGSRITVLPTPGGIGNPKVVNNKTSDLAQSYSLASDWAYRGVQAYDAPQDNIRALCGSLDKCYYLAVCTKESGITSLAEVAEKHLPIRLATVQVGGLGEQAASVILGYYGITYEDIESWGGTVYHMEFSAIVDAFKDGQCDMMIHQFTEGHPTLTELASTLDLNYLQFEPEMITTLAGEHAGFTQYVFPAGNFRGQDEEIPCLGCTTSIIVNKDMSDDMAYALTKALLDNVDTVRAAHAALKDFKVEDAFSLVGTGGVPLHPGAEKYYKEVGLIK